MRSEDITSLFTDTPAQMPVMPVSNSRTGQVTAFDPLTGASTIVVDGQEMTDLAIDVVGAVPLQVGDYVQIDTSTTRWYIKGKVSDPAPGVVPTWPADIAQAQADVAAAQLEVAAATAAVTELTDVTLPALDASVTAASDAVQELTDVTLPALQAELDGVLPITETDISDDAITTPKIAANAVTANEINALAVTTAKLDVGAVTAVKIAADTITAAQIAADSITTSELAAGAVTADEIAANAVTAAKIAAGAITADKVSASYVYAGLIAVEQLQGGSLTADVLLSSTIRTADTGARVEIGSFGIVTYGSDGTPQTVLPSGTGESNTFKGLIESAGATFTGGVSLRSTMNEVSRGATVTLQSGVTSPQQSPSSVVDLVSTVLPTATQGMGLVWKDSKWWTAEWNAGGTAYLVSYHATTGAEIDRIPFLGGSTAYIPAGGLAWSGTYWYTLGVSVTDGQWYLIRWDSFGVFQNGSLYTPLDGTAPDGWYWQDYAIAKMSIAYRAATGTVVIAEFDTTSTPQFRLNHRDATTCATVSTNFTASVAGFAAPVGGIAFGNFDFGSERMVIASRNSGTAWVFTTSGGTWPYQVSESFSTVGMLTGFQWDGSTFHAASIFATGTSAIYHHTNITWTTSTDGKWWAGFTWYDSNATGGTHETSMSPIANFTMKKRARYSLTSPEIPAGGTDDPNSVRFYLGKGSTLPASTAMYLQGTGGQGQVFTTATFSGTNPPTSGNFPTAATPGKIVNPGGSLALSGDGSAQFASLAVGGTSLWAPVYKIKPTNQTVTSNTTAVNDSDLWFPAEANATYVVKLMMIFRLTGNNTAALDAKVGFGGPTGYSWTGYGPGPTLAITDAAAEGPTVWRGLIGSQTNTLVFGVGGQVTATLIPTFIPLKAIVRTVSSGTVNLTWAQNTSNATGLIMNADSLLEAVRVA